MPLATFHQNERLGEIVIDSPPQNLFSAALLADLRAAVEEAADSDIRALLLRAEGDDFSAGADVSIFIGLDEARAAAIGQIEAVAGSIPYAGGTQRIASRIGAGRAAEMVLTAAILRPETLASWGLINRVLPADRLDEEGRAFAQSLASGPTRAHAVTKTRAPCLALGRRGRGRPGHPRRGPGRDAQPGHAGRHRKPPALRPGTRQLQQRLKRKVGR